MAQSKFLNGTINKDLELYNLYEQYKDVQPIIGQPATVIRQYTKHTYIVESMSYDGNVIDLSSEFMKLKIRRFNDHWRAYRYNNLSVSIVVLFGYSIEE